MDYADFESLVTKYPIYKRFLIQNILLLYDDELRLFLVNCLKTVDYLRDISEEILVHIAMHMIAFQGDKGSYLHSSEEGLSIRGMNESMLIIYDGALAVTTSLESGQEVVLDYIDKGTVINPHNFLTGQKQAVSMKCLTVVTYYYLPMHILQ